MFAQNVDIYPCSATASAAFRVPVCWSWFQQFGVKVGLLSGSQQFVTTPHRENKQPSALTLTTMDNIELPVSVVPVLTDHNLKRAHRGTRRPCKTLRNQTLALRCQCQPVRRTPGMLHSLAVQTTSSAKDMIMGRVKKQSSPLWKDSSSASLSGFRQYVTRLWIPGWQLHFLISISGTLFDVLQKKKKNIFGKKKKNPIC